MTTKPILLATFAAVLTSGILPAQSAAPAAMLKPASPNFAPCTREWKISLIPLLGSQALDISSSWGSRELNPLLASADGSFGMKAAGIKIGVTGAMIGVEYLIARKYPKAARVLAKVNWSGAALTSGLAVHNYAIR